MADDNNTGLIDYMVLRRTETTWTEIGVMPARNPSHAATLTAREMLLGQELDAEEFARGVELRAVTARAWNTGVTTLKAKTETKIVPS